MKLYFTEQYFQFQTLNTNSGGELKEGLIVIRFIISHRKESRWNHNFPPLNGHTAKPNPPQYIYS